MVLLACAVACAGLPGCGAVTLPSRITADVARMFPVMGDAVTMPFDAVGNTIDRGTAAAREQDAASLEQNA